MNRLTGAPSFPPLVSSKQWKEAIVYCQVGVILGLDVTVAVETPAARGPLWLVVSCYILFYSPNRFTCMASYSFHRVASLGRMILPLSPGLRSTLGALAACFYTCLPLVSHSGCSGPHDFTLVSGLSPTLGPTLGALGRMLLHLSATCLPHLSPTLGGLGRMILHLSPTLVSHSGCSGPHDFTLASHLFPTLGGLGRMILHLSPTLVSHSGCSGPHDFTLASHLFPTLGGLGRMILHLSPTCFLPLWVLWVT